MRLYPCCWRFAKIRAKDRLNTCLLSHLAAPHFIAYWPHIYNLHLPLSNFFSLESDHHIDISRNRVPDLNCI